MATATSDWILCHCCGKTFPAHNVVRFHCHPGDAICVQCAAWLYYRSRPIARRLNPTWHVPARMRPRVKGAR
jgi:hypothetical protein